MRSEAANVSPEDTLPWVTHFPEFVALAKCGTRLSIQEEVMRIGIIGAGMIGSTLAKLWVEADHQLFLSSRHPEELQSLVAALGENASAGTPAEAAEFAEVVMVTIPLKAVPQLAKEVGSRLEGKVVLDTGNAYEQRDGELAREATRFPGGTAGWAASWFPKARWVKAFNTVYFKTLQKEAHRSSDLVGIPLASDDRGALDVASRLVRDAGFEPVVVGPLARGREFEPGAPVYNTGMSAAALRRAFAKPDGAASNLESPRLSS
jgi:predicted dinucleotide-binding enzyme